MPRDAQLWLGARGAPASARRSGSSVVLAPARPQIPRLAPGEARASSRGLEAIESRPSQQRDLGRDGVVQRHGRAAIDRFGPATVRVCDLLTNPQRCRRPAGPLTTACTALPSCASRSAGSCSRFPACGEQEVSAQHGRATCIHALAILTSDVIHAASRRSCLRSLIVGGRTGSGRRAPWVCRPAAPSPDHSLTVCYWCAVACGVWGVTRVVRRGDGLLGVAVIGSAGASGACGLVGGTLRWRGGAGSWLVVGSCGPGRSASGGWERFELFEGGDELSGPGPAVLEVQFCRTFLRPRPPGARSLLHARG